MHLPYVRRGKRGGETIVLLAGFPDDSLSGWNSTFLEALGNDYDLICMCLPDYETKTDFKPWGFSFDEIVTMMDATISHALNEPGSTVEQFYLIIHDWGSFVGILYENKYPHNVKKLIALDVGLGLSKSTKDIFLVVFYQWWFAFSYIISQLISTVLGNIIFKLFFFIPFLKYIAPTPHDKIHRPQSEVNVHLCYPYYHIWKSIAFSTLKIPKFPTCPMLFIYGTRKNVMFHSPGFLKRLDATDGCKSLAVDAGHWVTHFQPEIVSEQALKFFAV